uniref:DEAD/DEAH box helicase n=1 Tax=uncultured Fusobacterium sp. TaxID=159267 RepID=UPI0025EC8476
EKRKRNLKALSLQTKKELFPKYDPTDNQKKAIEIALNTPDIALIQGPPGTGKTTVITAILKRLSEERKEIGNIAGNNLITSFQHDAVINAASRIKNLGGIPAEKYGQRGDSEDILNRVFRDYIDNALNEYYREEPQLKRKKEEEELLEIYDYYSKNLRDIPLKEEIISLLKQLYLFVSRYYIPNVKDEIDKLQDELNRVNKKKYFIEKRFFYKLPICQEMLEDGGRKFIEKSIETLESEIANGEISKEEFQREIEILNILSKREKIDFKVMKRCKNSILSKLAEIDIPFLDRSSNEKIEKIFESINQILKDIQETSKEYKDDIKIKYLRELENNPLRVRDTLRSYMSTFGATCQQTQGKQIKEAKNGGEKVGRSSFELEKCERYENVLIDEAARSNPPDLLIPMSMATERIILVGDHKQLPHLIDETIVDKMGKNSKSVKEEYEEQIKGKVVDNQLVKISMFEFLVEKCRELENIDGVKRLIMLDTQYRMHPKIGTFISENFYEGKLKNGLSADKFQTTLKGLEGKAFAWYDVPYTDEYREVTRSKSKVRTKEAEEIAKFIYKHIDSKEAEGKSFGIITFYREQVEEIYKELSKEKNLAYKDQKLIVEKQKNGEYKISDSYSNLGYEKLRIGSVDSFQGMEFNYVCLSMVRSNKNPLKDEKDVRSKFGFLTNPNRLCVAMSRQKELLVMFGDSQMLEEGEYSDIKPLQDFLRMCKEEREYGEYKSIL